MRACQTGRTPDNAYTPLLSLLGKDHCWRRGLQYDSESGRNGGKESGRSSCVLRTNYRRGAGGSWSCVYLLLAFDGYGARPFAAAVKGGFQHGSQRCVDSCQYAYVAVGKSRSRNSRSTCSGLATLPLQSGRGLAWLNRRQENTKGQRILLMIDKVSVQRSIRSLLTRPRKLVNEAW
jgi:hypothetical protein